MRRKLFIGVLAALCGALAHAQTGSVGRRAYDPNSPKHTISGMVVNAATGEPIARALVQLMGPLQQSELTDSQGSFRFEGVPEGRAYFMARKPGYFSSEQMSRGVGRPRAPVTISGDVASLVLKLTPEGIVSGTVTGDDGEPLEHVQVRLKRQVISNGRKQWEMGMQGQSDENGEFRLANFMPGTYYLVAEAPRPATARAAAEPNMGYAPAYYPGAPDLALASPIEVRGGQTAEIEFRLRSQPVFEVSGSVIGLALNQGGADVEFVNRSGDTIGASVHLNPDDHSFTAKVPAGTYTVRARSYNQQQQWMASTTVTVAANVRGLRLALMPETRIPVVVRADFLQNPPASTSGVTPATRKEARPVQYVGVDLVGIDEAHATAGHSLERDGQNLALLNVEPGRYAAQIVPRGPWYVESATYGQTDLLRDDMLVTSGGDARPIEIVLRDDGGSLSGSVTADNIAVPAVILVVPEQRSTAPQVRYASERGLTINSLSPGDYLLFAFDSVDGLEYSNREALEPYASRATHVPVSRRGSATVNLTLIKRGEP